MIPLIVASIMDYLKRQSESLQKVYSAKIRLDIIQLVGRLYLSAMGRMFLHALQKTHGKVMWLEE
jgi:hypothetical protein